MKLKLNVGGTKSTQDAAPPAASSPAPPTPGTSSGLIKLKISQPPTPSTEHPAPKKPTKKRPADEDHAPAPKRPANPPSRKISLKIKPQANGRVSASTPVSAGGLNKISLKRRTTAPKLTGLLNNKGRPIPKRKPGEGYDSEDSDVEQDPSQQQGFILRMEPGQDAEYVREAIANGRFGMPKEEGGADVTLKFITADLRRAVVRVRSRLYAAVLVDLPCIVESMKSWDRKGWWKVADVSQMLLVLGTCNNEEEAKTYLLPREVDEKHMQYAHGLTPPMHWVRRRRFRKRQSHRTIANIEEEVQRLLDEDDEIERAGGVVEVEDVDPYKLERSRQYDEDEDADADGDGDAIQTVEDEDDYEDDDDDDADGDAELAADLEADLEAAFQFDDAPEGDTTGLISQSPAPLSDPATSFIAGDTSMIEYPTAETPIAETPMVGTPMAETPMADPNTSDAAEDYSDGDDEDDDDDGSSEDEFDEDAAQRAAEKEQQREEIADLVREIANARAKAAAMTNQLLRNREMLKLQKLEEDLRNKRAGFGMEEDEDDDDAE